jgi:hypothetical protein
MARVTHRSGSYPTQVENAGSLGWPPVMPHKPGMQPLPQDPRKLRRELCRLNWSLHCILGVRAKLVLLVDRKDKQIAQIRRERDAYADALEAIDPALFELCEQERRDYDNPIKALEWAQRTGGDDDVL